MANRLYLAFFLAAACVPAPASLLQTDASLGSANPNGEPALIAAARTGNVDAIKQLLDHGADVNETESAGGQTALMWSVLENHLDAAKLLLERGADINAYTNSAMTALLFAAREGHRDMASLLLDRGADIKWNSADGTSPLLIAIVNGHTQLAMILLKRGADPNTVDSDGRGPLFAAVEMRHFGDAEDRTALIHALVEHGADVNARTGTLQDGETSFLRAAFSGDVSLMHYLLDHGANPNLATVRGTTPLMAASGVDSMAVQNLHSESDYLEAIKLCLEQGADINAANSDGLTAMHGAANRGWESVIQLLANNGARLDVKDNQGRTPMKFAESAKTLALLKSLMSMHN